MEGKGDTTPTGAGLPPGLLGEGENARGELPDADRWPVAGTGSPVGSDRTPEVGDSRAKPDGAPGLAAALAMIAELPLTPAEKADAVRRLLADQDAKGKP